MQYSSVKTPSAEDLISRVNHHLHNGNLKHAVVACSKLNSLYPNFPAGWTAASTVALALDNPAKAMEFVAKAIQLAPGHGPNYLIKAKCQFAEGKIKEATVTAAEIVHKYADDASLLNNCGHFLSAQCKDYPLAEKCFKRSTIISPDNGKYWYNLGSVQRTLGDLGAAEESWDRALAINPNDYEIYSGRSSLRTQTSSCNHTEELLKVIKNTPVDNWMAHVHLQYALAKEYEDIGEYDASFRSVSKGAQTRRNNLSYSVTDDIGVIDEIIEKHTADRLDPPMTGTSDDAPIFVLGLPRSGTTLVERILGSLDGVTAGGELECFTREMILLVRQSTQEKWDRLELVERTLDLDFAKLGHRYCMAARKSVGDSARFTDKLPLNYLYCGLIAKALPAAKFLFVNKHPLDSIYSMYKCLFKAGYPMSYSLDDLQQYYVAYRKLFEHWQKCLPDRVMNVSYEELIGNPEQVTRNITAFCNLEWDPSCLDIQKNKAASTTASAAQIRKPINSGAVGRWKRYEPHLAPVAKYLRSHGIAI